MLLGSLVSEVNVIVDLLATLQPTVADAAQRATKRAKLDRSVPLSSTYHTTANVRYSFRSGDTYVLLSLLGEVLGSKPLPGSLDLVTSLLETLSKVVHDTASSPADKTYTQQLLMSALENAANNIPVSSQQHSANLKLTLRQG